MRQLSGVPLGHTQGMFDMIVTVKVIPVILYMTVGIISLNMAYKNILSNKLIPFQEQAAGKLLNDMEKGIQFVILALMKVSGLGFLVVALLLIIFPIANYFINNSFVKYAIPAISILYCFGLFLINYRLFVQSKVETPWKRSLYAAIIVGVGLFLTLLL
jgi:hypothetical protein